eukprot:15454257-Alexandrium_andersonii.AAC.1
MGGDSAGNLNRVGITAPPALPCKPAVIRRQVAACVDCVCPMPGTEWRPAVGWGRLGCVGREVAGSR